jgi:hypothetical protein
MSYVSQVADFIISRSDCVSILDPEIYTIIAEWEKKEDTAFVSDQID